MLRLKLWWCIIDVSASTTERPWHTVEATKISVSTLFLSCSTQKLPAGSLSSHIRDSACPWVFLVGSACKIKLHTAGKVSLKAHWAHRLLLLWWNTRPESGMSREHDLCLLTQALTMHMVVWSRISWEETVFWVIRSVRGKAGRHDTHGKYREKVVFRSFWWEEWRSISGWRFLVFIKQIVTHKSHLPISFLLPCSVTEPCSGDRV